MWFFRTFWSDQKKESSGFSRTPHWAGLNIAPIAPSSVDGVVARMSASSE